MRSSLKPMYELMKIFKKHIHPDFVNAMKETPFGTIFMASTLRNLEETKGSNQT